MATSPALLDPGSGTADSGSGTAATSTRLLVTWQDPETRRYHPVGVLSRAHDGAYRFRYLPAARELDGFRPFLGFSSSDGDYTSGHLFPLFAERVVDESRPDRLTWLEALDLVDTAGPMEFLARSGGRRAGDTIELLPVPEIGGSRTSCVFLVHGVRHQPGASAAIDRLSPGHSVGLQPEPDNEHNPRAVLVTTDGTRLGWVPDPLLDYTHAVMATGDVTLTVVRANPPELGHHMRLLVRLEGRVPVGYSLPWSDLS